MLSEQQISILSSCRLSQLLVRNRESISKKLRERIAEKLVNEIDCLGHNVSSTLGRSKVILVSKLIDDYPELLNYVSSLLKTIMFSTFANNPHESEFRKIIIVQWIKCCSRSNDREAIQWFMKQLHIICTANVDCIAHSCLITTFFDVILATSSFFDWREYANDIFKYAKTIARLAINSSLKVTHKIIQHFSVIIRAIVPFSNYERCSLIATLLGACSKLLQQLKDDVLSSGYQTSSHISMVVDLASNVLSSSTYEHKKSKKNALLALISCYHCDDDHLEFVLQVQR